MSDVELRSTDLFRDRVCRPELKLGTSWALTASAVFGLVYLPISCMSLELHVFSLLKHAINLTLHSTSRSILFW